MMYFEGDVLIMLDYKNENWLVYKLGIIIFSVGVIICAIIQILNRKSLDYESIFILINIQQIMLIIVFALHGSREVLAKNSRSGYIYYFTMIFTIVVFIVRNFLD